MLKLLLFISIIFSTQSFAQVSIDASGSGGGAIVVGESTDACDSSIQGALRFNTSNQCVEYCSGSAWTCPITTGASCSLSSTTFTAITGLAKLEQANSNALTISGTCKLGLVSEDSTPTVELRINSTNTGKSAVTVSDGDSVQVRVTGASMPNTTQTVKVWSEGGSELASLSFTTANFSNCTITSGYEYVGGSYTSTCGSSTNTAIKCRNWCEGRLDTQCSWDGGNCCVSRPTGTLSAQASSSAISCSY